MFKRTYARPFPDHWEKNAIAIIILMRLRFPGVLKSVSHPTDVATSRSSSSAVLISWNSYSTRGSLLKVETYVRIDNRALLRQHLRVPFRVVVSQGVKRLLFPTHRISHYFNKPATLSTNLPLCMSHLGDSGTNQINISWMTEGNPWIADGIRHDQLVWTWKVPNVFDRSIPCQGRCIEVWDIKQLTVHAAMKLPKILYPLVRTSNW